ncbi:MAG: hypothetical protein AAGD07_05330 [Planctomycetota bacterium]
MSLSNAEGPSPDNNPFQNTPTPENVAGGDTGVPASNKGPWGCILWGCLGVAGFSVLGMLLAGFLTWRFLTGQVEKYTDQEAAEIPVVQYDDEALEELNQRLEQFQTQVRGPDVAADETESDVAEDSDSEALEQSADAQPALAPMQELRLSAEEINALIGANEQLRGKVFVRIEAGQLSGQVSIPTDMIPGGKGRFFNADADFSVSMENGVLVVRLTGARVKGEAIPDEFMQGFAQQNLAKDAYNDTENAEILRKIESIQVVEDSILLKLRPVESEEALEREGVPESQSSSPIDAEAPSQNDAPALEDSSESATTAYSGVD